MRRADVIFWWMVAMGVVIVAAAVFFAYPRMQGGAGGCDELLDRLTDARVEYHRSDSARDFNTWWDAAHDYCGECKDWKLCDGKQPR